MRDVRYIFRSVIRSRISAGVLANTCSRAANNKVDEVLVGSRFDSLKAENMTDGVEDRWVDSFLSHDSGSTRRSRE